MLTWFCRLRFRSSLSYVYCKVLTVKNDTYNWCNSVMAFAHRYDKNKDDYGDNNYCYDDIPKVAIVLIYK